MNTEKFLVRHVVLEEAERRVVETFAENMGLKASNLRDIKSKCKVLKLTPSVKDVSIELHPENAEIYQKYQSRIFHEAEFFAEIEEILNELDNLFELESQLASSGETLPKENLEEIYQLEAKLYEISESLKELYKHDGNLINKYSIGESVFLVLSGQLKSYVTKLEWSTKGNGGIKTKMKSLTLNLHNPGDILGEIAIILNTLRTAHVRPTISGTRVLEIPKEVFESWKQTNPSFSDNLMKLLARRVIRSTQQSRSLALEQVYDRFKQFVEDEIGHLEQGHTLTIPQRFSQAIIAQHIGTTRSNITGILDELTKQGYLQISDEEERTVVKCLPEKLVKIRRA